MLIWVERQQPWGDAMSVFSAGQRLLLTRPLQKQDSWLMW